MKNETPSIAQVAALAEIGTTSAIERGVLLRGSIRGFYRASDRCSVVRENDSGEHVATARHNLGFKVGRTAIGSYKLLYVDSFHTDTPASMRTAYHFEWTSSRVLQAIRRSSITDRLGDTRRLARLGDVEDDYDVPDDPVSRFKLEMLDDYTQMTADDCDFLAVQLREYYSAIAHDESHENMR